MTARVEALHMVKDYTFALTTGSYTISASLIINDMFHFIDSHNWVIGALLGIVTYFTNLYFHLKNVRCIDDKR